MQYIRRRTESRDPDGPLCESLEQLIREIGMSLVELNIFRRKGRGVGSVQVKAVILAKGTTGLSECTKVHHVIYPRLELAFPGKDVYLEVSSPGINRIIKDASEFTYYIGRGVKCYRTDISDWTKGILRAADEEKIALQTDAGETVLFYENIAKAQLG